MKIGTVKSQLLKSDVLEFLGDEETAKVLVATAKKWAEECALKTLKEAFKSRKYYTDDTIEFSVSVSFSTQTEEDSIKQD